MLLISSGLVKFNSKVFWSKVPQYKCTVTAYWQLLFNFSKSFAEFEQFCLYVFAILTGKKMFCTLTTNWKNIQNSYF